MTAITYAIPVWSTLDYQLKPFEDHRWPVSSALLNIFNPTSNDQRLGSAGDNDRRSKRFCPTLYFVYISLMVEGRNAHDPITFFAFHSFLVEV